MHCVYILVAASQKHFKIGRSAHLQSRVCALNKSTPLDLTASWAITSSAPEKLEKALHYIFAAHRIPDHGQAAGKTEWFSIEALSGVKSFIETNATFLGVQKLDTLLASLPLNVAAATEKPGRSPQDNGPYLGKVLANNRQVIATTLTVTDTLNTLLAQGDLVGGLPQSGVANTYILLMQAALNEREQQRYEYMLNKCNIYPSSATDEPEGVAHFFLHCTQHGRMATRSSDYHLAKLWIPNPEESPLGRDPLLLASVGRHLKNWVEANLPGAGKLPLPAEVKEAYLAQVSRPGVDKKWRILLGN